MEIPFKYIVLCIIKMLNERNMSLNIQSNTLRNYITVVISELLYTIEEKKQLGNNFDFQYELDDLLNKYSSYFDFDGNKIIFDSDYIDELESLITDEAEELDRELIDDYDYAIEGNTLLLSVLGVKINKELYNFLIGIEQEIEACYNILCNRESMGKSTLENKKEIHDKLKKLLMKKVIMFVNCRSLLSTVEYYDVMQYSSNVVDRTNDDECVDLLYESEEFNESDIVSDAFLRAIFTSSESYISNLDESFIVNYSKNNFYDKQGKIIFYSKLLSLINIEINNYQGILKSELIKVKYRLMNVLDSAYGTATFVGNCNNLNVNDSENYNFISETVSYFINELLMYDDEKYRNNECDTENIMVYFENIMKMLIIKTYYELTREKTIINEIKNNELYGVNNISSGLLKDIVDNPKIKIKEV